MTVCDCTRVLCCKLKVHTLIIHVGGKTCCCDCDDADDAQTLFSDEIFLLFGELKNLRVFTLNVFVCTYYLPIYLPKVYDMLVSCLFFKRGGNCREIRAKFMFRMINLSKIVE